MIGRKAEIMAKQSYGILDGYRGTVGPVIGYQWRGRWCLRARPRFVSNPRTEKQQAHRMLFRDMVQTAGHLTGALRYGLRQASLEQGMTEGNLFVKMNKHCFTPQGVDYENLALSAGPVAPVAFDAATVDAQGVLQVTFEKNPLHMRADAGDMVRLALYCPDLKRLVVSAAVQRRAKRLAVALPDDWAGHAFHLWGFVQDYQQRASECQYIPLAANGEGQEKQSTEHNDYEKDNNISFGRAAMPDGMEPAGDRLGLEGRREDGDADARRRGAGGSGADFQ